MKGAGLIGVVCVNGGFDLEREVATVFLVVPAEEPELTVIVKATGVSGAVPDLSGDGDFGSPISAPIEVAF